MTHIINLYNIEEYILNIRETNIILDKDVATIYGVETKRINEAVKNNPDKFPEGYILTLDNEEVKSLRSNFSTLKENNRGKHSKYNTKAFTEKGLYMLATILKSPTATETTIAIIETFTKIRELSRTIVQLTESAEEHTQKYLTQKSSDIITDILGNDMQTTNTETTIELNLAVLKLKHTIKRK